MRMSTRSVFSAILMIVLVLALGGCAQPAAEPPAPAPVDGSTDASPGQALVEQKCTMCHTLDRVDSAKYDNAGWTATVERMVQNGLVVSADEKSAIIEYLSTRGAAE